MDACEKVSHIEFVYSKASLTISLQGVPAILSTDRTVNLMRARHPLIPPKYGRVKPIKLFNWVLKRRTKNLR